MNLENIRMLELAAEHLGDLLGEVVFVGGATVELWITDEAAPEFRPTDDIDVVVEITTVRDYHRFEKRVREAGFEHDHGRPRHFHMPSRIRCHRGGPLR
jgi:ASC-1-like (ASCH) protein